MNPSLILIFLALFTWGIGEGMFMYFQSIHLQNLGANPVAIGSILSFMGVAMMISHIPAGHLSDRVGRRPLLMTAWGCGIVATLLMAAASSLPLFVAGLLLYGFTAFVSSPLSSYVTAARGAWSVSRALSFMSVAFNLGAVLGPLTGGWIGGQFGLRWVFAAAAVTFVISTAFLVFIKPQPLDHHDPESPPPSLWNNPRYLGFIALVFVIVFAMYLPQPLTTNFLQSERGLSLQQIGLLGSVAVLGNATITFVFGSWFSARRGMIVGQVLSAAFALLIWRMTAFPIYALAYFLLGGFRAVRPMLSAQVRGLVHESQMGLAFGMNETVGSIALTLAPFAAGLLYDQAPDLVYPVSLGAIALAIFLTLIFSPRGTHA
ncbi:MAG: MFS transporter [Chloroflexota bacterium]